MKLSLAVVAALAACVSATPIRIITINGGSVDGVNPFATSEAPLRAMPVDPLRKPCHSSAGTSSYIPRPISVLLSRLGITSPDAHDEYRSPRHAHVEVIAALREENETHRLIESWKQRVEGMMHDVEEEVVPLMQGGEVQILPIINDEPSDQHNEQHGDHHHHHHHHHDNDEHRHKFAKWKALEGKEGVKKHHHKHVQHHAHPIPEKEATSFSCRLNRAMQALSATEALVLAFVLGAGLGSILHFVFMLVLLSIRFFGCSRGGMTRAERRAARKARRAARKAEKVGGGAVRLEGEEGDAVVEEVLPTYAEADAPTLESEKTPL